MTIIHASISEIPIGKVARVGAWLVSRWGVDEFDVHPDKPLRGSVFKDGAGGTGLRMGLTLN